MSYITTFNISIHALREEGDMYSIPGLVDHHYFYPRPPRGGRRFGFLILILLFSISIHALREEGDVTIPLSGSAPLDFYPRPPRGGRRGF